VGEAPRLDASNDTDFRPDRALAERRGRYRRGWTIEGVTTPGHTANHMAFALKEAKSVVLRRSRQWHGRRPSSPRRTVP